MPRTLRCVASLTTTALFLVGGAAFAPSAHAAPAGCGNNVADYTGSAFTLTLAPDIGLLPNLPVTFNSDGTLSVGNPPATPPGTFEIAASNLTVGGSGTVNVDVSTGVRNVQLVLTPECLVGTTVRQLNGWYTTGFAGGFGAATLSRPSL